MPQSSPAVPAQPEAALESSRGAKIGAAWVVCLLVLIVWMDQSILPVGVAVDGPDGSFQTAFEYFFKHGSRAGHDWVYTYGPLAFIENFTYDPELFLGRLIFADILWRTACAVVVVLAFLRNAGALERGLGVAVLVVLPLNPDAYIYLFTLAAAEICIDRPHSRALLATALIVLVPASLAKFTSFGLLVPAVLAIAIALVDSGTRRAALGFLCATGLFWLALWMVVCRQAVSDLPAFLWHSFDMAGAYARSMGSECPPGVELHALAVLVLAAATLFLPLFSRPRATSRFARALLRLFVLAAVFKAGVVRGADHTMIFFTFAAVAPFVIVARLPEGSHLRRAHLALKLATSAAAFWALIPVDSSLGQSAHLFAKGVRQQVEMCVSLATRFDEVQAECDEQLAEARRRRGLPRIRAVVQRDTIDIHPPFQDMIVFNDLHWRPRPVFQSYATLSEGLQQLNARFLESEHAPQWFLLMPRPIDARMPTMEDAAALLVLARDYQPALKEGEMLLLKRVPQPAAIGPNEIVLEREMHAGERLDLSGLGPEVHLLQLEVRPTLRGKIRALLLRPVPIYAVLSTASGREVGVQLIPAMLESGAIVDPLIVDTQDWIRFYAGRADRTAALTLLPTQSPRAYPESVTVRIVRTPLRPAHIDIDAEWNTRFSMFTTRPDDFSSATEPHAREEGGEIVLAIDTPSVLRFRVARGRYRVSGVLGALADSYERGASDGVTFQGYFSRGLAQFQREFERTLDPRNRAVDRGPQFFAFEFEADVSGELVLCTRPGPQHDFEDDGAFWSRIAVLKLTESR